MTLNLAGLKIGHATDPQFHTGCTVFLCPPGTLGSVDVRGPAPGSRESDLLSPVKPIERVDALVFTGGSAFGLATADGVMRYLAERNIGHPTPIRPIPLVPAAVVYDLFLGNGRRLPDADMGYAACLDARPDNVAQGNIGAGTGVTVGKWGMSWRMMKGGFGLASLSDGDLVVTAAAVVNAIGDVVNADGTVLAGAYTENGGWLVEGNPLRRLSDRPVTDMGANTTLALIATNARLTKVQAYRLAERAHDGLALAIHPVHTTHDGDTTFALSTGQVAASFDWVAAMGVTAVAEAIRNAVRHAQTVSGIRGLGAEK